MTNWRLRTNLYPGASRKVTAPNSSWSRTPVKTSEHIDVGGRYTESVLWLWVRHYHRPQAGYRKS